MCDYPNIIPQSLAILGSFAILIFIIAIMLYILKSIGLYTIAERRKINNSWLAWIPFGDSYILAKIIKTIKIGTFEVPKPELFLPIGGIIIIFLKAIPILDTILFIAYTVILYFAIYYLYQLYREKNCVLYLVLTIIFPFLYSIFVFSMRNDPATDENNYINI